MLRFPNIYTDPTRASNMASSSRPSPLSISVSLRSNKTTDRRTLHIRADESCAIGRSSKSEIKNLQAAPENALFDCPVVSRIHAELKASPWQPFAKQVTITDRSSLHGTMVNGMRLLPGRPFALKSGDIIKLGEQVTRGDDTHDGVSLTFYRLDETTASLHHYSPTSVGRSFSVPSPSDLEDSDEAESDIESLHSYHEEHSSAKTTPEQVRVNMASLGSQEKPINLEASSTPSKIIDLDQSDHEDTEAKGKARGMVGSLTASNSKTSAVNPFVVELDKSVSVPESVRKSLAAQDFLEISDAMHNGLLDDDNDTDDAESVHVRNTGLSQILNQRDRISSDIDHESNYGDWPEVEGEAENSAEEADALSESAASDFSLAGEDSDVEEPSDWPAHRPVSPELGGERPQATNLATDENIQSFDSFTPLVGAVPKPRYDPVRNSQPPAEEQARCSTTSQFQPRPPPTYTYGPFGYGTAFVNSPTDYPTSSRWDIPPSVPTFPTNPLYPDYLMAQQTNYTPSYSCALPLPPPPPPPPPPAALAAPVNATMSSVPLSQPMPTTPNLPNSTASVPVHVPPTKGKISITDIVEESKDVDTAEETAVQNDRSSDVLASTNSGTKRKATEVDAQESAPVEDPVPLKKQKRTSGRVAISSSNRHRRSARSSSIFRRAANSAVHLATGAVFGAAATVAFLRSPAAQSLIDWMD